MVDQDACRLYELFDAPKVGGGLAGRQRRDLGPALERAPPGRLDQRRRRGPADPARPRPLRRGRGRRRSPTPCGSRRTDDAHGATSTRPATTPAIAASTRRCRRWACASGSRRPSTSAGFVAAGPGHRRRAQALRDDPRRQRLAVVRHRARSDPHCDDDVLHELGVDHRARSSRSSTRPGSSTARALTGTRPPT